MVEEILNRGAAPPRHIIPALRKDLKVISATLPGDKESSWIIQDPVNGKYFRIHSREHKIVSILSRDYELQELIKSLELSGVKITEKELLGITNFLFSNGLLTGRYYATENVLATKNRQIKAMRAQSMVSSLLFLKIPIFNPDRFLDRSIDYIKAIFNKWTLYSLIVLSLIGYLCVIPQWSRLSAQFFNSLSYQGALEYGITLIILKILHEFSHAYAAKASGIPVRRMGLFFIVFFPRLYTDITDSWQILDRRRKMLIDGAGILFEIVVGGLAALIWINSSSGVLNSTAYYIFAISVISAILVNGNPLIKFDGYFLLMDFLNIDNLQRQSVSVLRSEVYRLLFGLALPGEGAGFSPLQRKIMIIYSVAAFIYKIFLYTGIILIIYFMFTKTLAVILIIFEIYAFVIAPLKNEVKIFKQHKIMLKNKRVYAALSGLVLLVLLLFIPIPWNIEAPAVTVSLNSESVFVSYEGFLKEVLPSDGKNVTKGEVLYIFENPFLELEICANEAELEKLVIQRNLASINYEDLGMVNIINEQISGIRKRLDECERQKNLLTVTAPMSGTFSFSSREIKPGRWFHRGEKAGEVFNPKNQAIFAYVEEKDISKVTSGEKASFYFADKIMPSRGRVISVSSVPSDDWQNSPLLSSAGGPIEVLKPNHDGTLDILHSYYQVIISPVENTEFPENRSGKVKISSYSSVAGNFIRLALSLFHREFAF